MSKPINCLSLKTDIQDNIDKALRGEESAAVIYWDTQDPRNPGPAFRCLGESGPLEFVRWNTVSGIDWVLEGYFSRNGEYGGPDCLGVYPILKA